jgi:hypothetical protein
MRILYVWIVIHDPSSDYPDINYPEEVCAWDSGEPLEIEAEQHFEFIEGIFLAKALINRRDIIARFAITPSADNG